MVRVKTFIQATAQIVGTALALTLSGCAAQRVEVPIEVPVPTVPVGVLDVLVPVEEPTPGDLRTNGDLADLLLDWIGALRVANGRLLAGRKLLEWVTDGDQGSRDHIDAESVDRTASGKARVRR